MQGPFPIGSKTGAHWARSAVLLALGGFVTGLAIIVATAILGLNLRARAIDDRLATMQAHALMLSAHVDSALQAVEAVQNGLIDQITSPGVTPADQFARSGASAARHQSLKERAAALPYLNSIAVIDRNGMLVNSSRSWPVEAASFADRDYFKAMVPANAPQRMITAPLEDRTAETGTFYLVRRIGGPNGTFLGVVLAAIELPYFQRFFMEAEPEPDAVASLLRDDVVPLLRHPLPRDAAQPQPSDANPAGRIRSSDGQDRLAAVHHLAHYPVAVSLTRTVHATLQPWRRQIGTLAGIAVLLNAGLLGLIVLGVQNLRANGRLDRVKASLARSESDRAAAEANERNERALALYYERFNTAVYSMSQGLCMFDATDRLIISNSRFKALFGMSAGLLDVGTPLAVAMHAAVRSRVISIRDIRRLKQALGGTHGFPNHATAVWDVANGCAFSVSFRRMTGKGWLMTFEDITERRRTEAQIAHMAHHDALTGLPNRVLFRERLVNAVALAERGLKQGVLCLDLDHFKEVNDTLGHPVGDALLQAVTARLLRCVRDTDTVARLGGDEFAIILSSLGQPRDADVLTDRLIQEISLPFEIAGHQVVVGVSIGIAITPDDGVDPDTLLKNADLALYQSKADGRGCCRYFRPEMDAVQQARRQLEMDLRHAVAHDEFRLYYQPLIRTGSRIICAFEALLHWCPPGRPPLGAAEFIPAAEEIGLIVALGKWVLETACRQAMSWPDPIAVAVNISSVQLKHHAVVDMVRAALNQTGLAPGRLELEINETVLLHDTTETLDRLRQLKALGVRISMDDFGTGYSALSYLLRFPFDKVKIDRSFMADLGHGGASDAIVRAIMGMCQDLGMDTIAEGVETPEQLAFLHQLKCAEVQGFLFSRAVAGDAVAALLASFAPRDPTRAEVVG